MQTWYRIAILVGILLVLSGGCQDAPPKTPSPDTLPAPSGNLTVHVLDVGQGDAILLRSPAGRTMLVDAGSIGSAPEVLAYLNAYGFKSLDVAVATHPDADHIGGMVPVLEAVPVRQFVDAGYPHTTGTYENMLATIDRLDIPYRTPTRGDTLAWDPAVRVAVLNPPETFHDGTNENSVVLRVSYGAVDVLLMGDAESAVEREIADEAIDSEILKVAHHGSASSTSEAFLGRVTPEVSIISVGSGNPFGHPAAETIRRLEQTGSAIYRTDQDGTISVISDGRTYRIETERSGTVLAATPASSWATACDCTADRFDCSDFSCRPQAQACHDYCLPLGKGDMHQLDSDSDGEVCESPGEAC
ncbi:MAG: ComEC/Rec2 family competence protein [Methanomicrobiales archaeon]|nr:ComEC/Rec2 family competence protein [Methanomicrobiales archaeon]